MTGKTPRLPGEVLLGLVAVAFNAMQHAVHGDQAVTFDQLTSDERKPLCTIADKLAAGGDVVINSAAMQPEMALYIDIMFVLVLNLTPPSVPATVTDPKAAQTYAETNYLRRLIKYAASQADALRHNASALDREDFPEVGANLTLTYRHLEDASMRAGKGLQALDGGVSVYDRSTTVGA